MSNEKLIEATKQFFAGKDHFIDTMYNKRLQEDEKVICFTIDDTPDFIKAKAIEEMCTV